MTTTIVTVTLALALSTAGGWNEPDQRYQHPLWGRPGGYILPPLPGNGAGFPNGNPDGYGWFEIGPYLPLGADRTAEYYFRKYWVVPPEQMFLGTYYNPYVNRGQRYIPYAGGGGCHPMGGPPQASAVTPVSPYGAMPERGPVAPVPRLNGRVEAPLINSGGSGLTP
jgi:hypothetical protein